MSSASVCSTPPGGADGEKVLSERADATGESGVCGEGGRGDVRGCGEEGGRGGVAGTSGAAAVAFESDCASASDRGCEYDGGVCFGWSKPQSTPSGQHGHCGVSLGLSSAGVLDRFGLECSLASVLCGWASASALGIMLATTGAASADATSAVVAA